MRPVSGSIATTGCKRRRARPVDAGPFELLGLTLAFTIAAAASRAEMHGAAGSALVNEIGPSALRAESLFRPTLNESRTELLGDTTALIDVYRYGGHSTVGLVPTLRSITAPVVRPF